MTDRTKKNAFPGSRPLARAHRSARRRTAPLATSRGLVIACAIKPHIQAFKSSTTDATDPDARETALDASARDRAQTALDARRSTTTTRRRV